MNRLALGTAQFGFRYGVTNSTGQVTHDAASSMLKLAQENKIDTLDTAIAYGQSENRIGNAGIQGFKVVTKLSLLTRSLADASNDIARQVAQSLDRLRVEKVYGVLLHRPEQLLGEYGEAIYRGLMLLKERGKAEKIGISIYSPLELDQLADHFHFDIVQAPLSLVDRRIVESGWLGRLKDREVEIHCRSVFLQGLLLINSERPPGVFENWPSLWSNWRNWLQDYNASALESCLGFSLSFPEVDRVVVGADSVSQLVQIIAAASRPLTAGFPKIKCNDEALINPSRWPQL